MPLPCCRKPAVWRLVGGHIFLPNKTRVFLSRKKGTMGIGWPLTVTAIVLNQCCFYSVFGKSTQFQRKKSALSQTHLDSHSRFATHALYKRGRITFNALSFRFIIYKMEAVILTFQVAEYVTCGGYSIDSLSFSIPLLQTWQKCGASGLSPACQSAVTLCPWAGDTRVRISWGSQTQSDGESKLGIWKGTGTDGRSRCKSRERKPEK